MAIFPYRGERPAGALEGMKQHREALARTPPESYWRGGPAVAGVGGAARGAAKFGAPSVAR
jgi:hypothetical protein